MRDVVIKILKHLLIISVISVTGSIIIYSFKVDYKRYHKDTIIEQKMDSLKSKDYNVLFFGSSSAFRNFNPHLFDSLSKDIFTYDAGIPAMFPFRQFDFIEEAIKIKDKKYKAIFTELIDLDQIGPNYDKTTFHYSINLNRYKVALMYPFQIKSGYKTYTSVYTKLFFYKYYGFGIANHIRLLFNIEVKNNSIPAFVLPVNNTINGFIPLDSMLNSRDLVQKEYYTELRNEFVNSDFYSTEKLKEWFTPEKNNDFKNHSYFSEEYLKVFEHISEKTDKVIIIVPPRLKADKRLSILKNYFIKKGYIVWDFSDPAEYPELFSREHSFDYDHLDAIGANIYTKLLAEKYNKLQ